MFYIKNISISSQQSKKRLNNFFYRDITVFYEVPLTPLFSVTQHHEKLWDPPNPYVSRSYWTACSS